ncbi:Uncharacterized protein SCF082_LOCUS15240 [Durusdinium trenchii]|uniref:Uncharacterized protein n=1 Tax=Durusdinium trenchii TaxID=1381693 RepID=A0ABP0K4X2_9DINO
MAWQKALLLAILLESIRAIRESVEISEEVRRSVRLAGQSNESAPEQDVAENEDDDEDEEDAKDDKGKEASKRLLPGKKHGEAKWMYKTATDGFHDLDKVVESIDAAADDASTKAKRVDSDYAKYRGLMHSTGVTLDGLSLAGEKFKKEVVDYFANAETDKFSPLAMRVPDRDFIPNAEAIEKLRVVEVSEHPCKEPVVFCCAKGMVWSDVRQRTSFGCEASEGGCGGGRLELPAVSRLEGTKDQSEEKKGRCVPKDSAHYFRKSSDWEDENRIEESDLLSDLALLPEAENILAEKLSAANTPKHALVQNVCRNELWVALLNAVDAQLCGTKASTTEPGEGEDLIKRG